MSPPDTTRKVKRSTVRATVPTGPRAILRAALEDALEPTAVAGAAIVARAPRRVVLAWQRVAAGPPSELALELARGYTEAWLNPPDPESTLDLDRAMKRQASAAANCRKNLAVLDEEGTPYRYAHPARCNRRACLECRRRQLRAIVRARWAILFAAPLRAGWVLEMFTVGNGVAVSEDRQDVRDYTAALRKLHRAMVDGVEDCAIPPDTWAAGLRILEAVPRETGAWLHAHIVIVRRRFYPYGLSDKRLRELYARGETPTAEQLGAREVMRRCGLTEVGRHDILTGDGDGHGAVNDYLWKVEDYLRKSEKDDENGGSWLSWEGHPTILRMLRGVRMAQGFGDADELFGGPMWTDRLRAGQKAGALLRCGFVDVDDEDTWGLLDFERNGKEDGEAHPADERRATVTYREDTLRRWDSWCDVARLREWMARTTTETDRTTPEQEADGLCAPPASHPRATRQVFTADPDAEDEDP